MGGDKPGENHAAALTFAIKLKRKDEGLAWGLRGLTGRSVQLAHLRGGGCATYP